MSKEKSDEYWKGYIQKQNESMEICKICRYRTKFKELEKQVEDSTPNSVIREKIEELDNKRKVYYENDEIYAKFFDFARLEEKRTAKITRKDVEISNKNNQLYGAIEVLKEILKEGEK